LRRACVDQVGMFDESMRSHEDIELWLRICQKWKVALVDKPLTHRRQGAANMTSNDNLRTEYGVKVFEKALQLPDLTTAQHDTMIGKLADVSFQRGTFHFAKGQMQECRKSLRQSLGCRKSNPKAWIYYAASFVPPPVMDLLGKKKKS
jgi:hypothetical protein